MCTHANLLHLFGKITSTVMIMPQEQTYYRKYQNCRPAYHMALTKEKHNYRNILTPILLIVLRIIRTIATSYWQFCTTGPGGIGVGYEWDGSQLDHPNPRPTTLAFFGHINTSVPKINFWKCLLGLDKLTHSHSMWRVGLGGMNDIYWF